jgi:TolB-like protein/Tfp pilus assembly protein PilF
MNPRSFFAELKRRNVYKVAVGYAIVAWLLIQAASILFPTFEAPTWVMKVFVAAIVLGFPVALILAWAFELTPEGIKRAEEVPPNESITHKTGRLALQFLRAKSATALAVPVAALSPGITDKSIAVLPFENRSSDQENAFFADGVQDEILTYLAKVADLKVISRTSVMRYKTGTARNLSEIGQQLGVAHLLEGSVQRAAGKVRVNAQLIDARTDAHLWAHTYDRDLADVFAIQSEIAKTIADQLQAKLSPTEKAAIEQPPTANIAAFDLYTRAKTLLLTGLFGSGKDQWLQAVELLNQAVSMDPGFFDAYCQLVIAHDHLYITNLDHTPARLAAAEAALDTAVRLRPDSGEAHFSRAGHFLRKLDYEQARAELALAQGTLVNSPKIFEWAGYIDRRQGRWEECIRNLDRALELDPRNLFILQHVALTNDSLRRYATELAALDRALDIVPKNIDLKIARASIDLDWHANSQPLRAAVGAILADDPTAAATLAFSQLGLAFYDRDLTAAERALADIPADANFGKGAIVLSRSYVEGQLARLRGNPVAAQVAFTTARAQQEESVRAQPDYAPALCVLGLIDGALGRKEEALCEGRRAVELTPITRDAIDGVAIVEFFARTCVWLGEKNLAFQYLTIATQNPGHLSYGNLRLDPDWDSLRGDPRFEKIVADLAPKPSAP